MPAATDIKLENNEPVFENGDMVVDFSDEQHKQDIFDSAPGWWKEFLLVGINIRKYIGSVGKQSLIEKNAKMQLRTDGYEDKDVVCTQVGDLFEIDSDAERI